MDVAASTRAGTPEKCLQILVDCPVADMVLLATATERGIIPSEEIVQLVSEAIDRYHKPIIIYPGVIEGERREETFKGLGKEGLIPYLSLHQAAKALSALTFRSEYLER